MTKFRTQYEPRKVHKTFKGLISLTDQQYKDECSIEGIVKKYGILPAPSVTPMITDVSEVGDFVECMQRVEDGLAQFAELPSSVRSRFGNDPRALYEWLADPSNVEEAVKLGLMVPRKEEKSAVDVLNEIKDKLVSPAKDETAA